MGQNLGANKPERAVRAVWVTALYNVLFLGSLSLAFICAPYAFVQWFSTSATEAGYAMDLLRIIGYGGVIYAVGMVVVQAFNGAGDTVTPTVINVIGFWLLEIPIAYALAYGSDWRVTGVFSSIPIAEFCITAMGAAMFLLGRWKTRRI